MKSVRRACALMRHVGWGRGRHGILLEGGDFRRVVLDLLFQVNDMRFKQRQAPLVVRDLDHALLRADAAPRAFGSPCNVRWVDRAGSGNGRRRRSRTANDARRTLLRRRWRACTLQSCGGWISKVIYAENKIKCSLFSIWQPFFIPLQ